MKHVNNFSKLSEVALACVVDLCRAAAYIDPEAGDVPLRIVAVDIAHDIKASKKKKKVILIVKSLFNTFLQQALLNGGYHRKPFWESYDDIDLALYADALVAIFRFLPVEDSTQLFQQCSEPERSEPVKTCAIRACVTLVQDAPRFRWQKPLIELADAVATRCRDILKVNFFT